MSAAEAPSQTNPEIQKLLDVARDALELARQRGAQQADAVANRGTEFEVKVADGEIVNLTQATSKGLGVRVFVDQRLGFCTLSDFSRASVIQGVERAIAMAKESAPDPNNGLADAKPGHISAGDALDLFDPAIPALDAEQKIEWAHALEAAARKVDPAVCKFRDSGVASGEEASVLVTSTGAERSIRSTGISIWCNPIASRDGELQTEVWFDSKTHLEDLDSVDAVGRTAGQRAFRMLGAKPVKTQQCPIIWEPAMAAGLVGGVLGAIDGDMVYKRASFLSDKLGERIATDRITLVDDPWLPRGVASMPFDGEGLKTYRKNLLDSGRVTTFLYDTYTARKAGVQSTANAQRSFASLPHAGCFNVYVQPGSDVPEDIIRNTQRGLLVTRGMGSGVNLVTGEYSRGANGLWIENGEVVHPVQEVTIAGDYVTMLQNIDRIGSDFHMRGARGAPTLRVAEMTVSGSG